MTALLFSFAACGSKYEAGISEGRIIYGVNFPKKENNSALVSIMPDKVEMSFKNNNTALNIKGFWGAFNISFITDNQNNKYYALLRIGADKFKHVTDSLGIFFGYDVIKNIEIEYLKDTMSVCNYLCYKAVAHCKDINRDLELWYTKDIKLDKPNVNNAFKALDGVLMKFQVIMSGFFMELTAEEVISEEVSDDVFAIPDNYKDAKKEDLEPYLKSFENAL